MCHCDTAHPPAVQHLQVFVEPIPQLYEQLQQSIQHWPNAVALNYAISPDPLTPESQATMWCYEPALNSSRLGRDLPFWANQICSFNASHISAHFKGQQGVAVAVTAVSLQQLLKRGSISNVQVSAELCGPFYTPNCRLQSKPSMKPQDSCGVMWYLARCGQRQPNLQCMAPVRCVRGAVLHSAVLAFCCAACRC
jgi:hypothetical protein